MAGGSDLFGSISSISSESATIVFVAVMIFLTFVEGAMHNLEKVGGRRGYRLLIMKLYREFMVLGFNSFAIELLSSVTSLPKDDKWYEAFHFAHIVILFVGIVFLFQSLLLVSFISYRKKRLLYYETCSSESLFVEYIHMRGDNSILSRLRQFMYDYGPVSIPIPTLREKIEFKIVQEYFIRSYQLDPKFKFAKYMCKVLKNYIISLVEVRPVNWFRLAFLVFLNYVRILVVDPIYQSDVCASENAHAYVKYRSKSYGYHVCAEYQLRVIFVGTVIMTLYFLSVFYYSEVYMQRLIGKVLDDEETLQWLDTEEAAEESRRKSFSAFPHPLELLNPDETLFKKTSSKAGDVTAPSTAEDLGPIKPAIGSVPRFGSESATKTNASRRSSLRRSLSYKSPLNGVDSSITHDRDELNEAPIAAPPRRGVRERGNSITVHVPLHLDSLPERSRGSLASMEDMQALTADVNPYNRRHLYLKCLERIINVEYSYHETEARRTSISSETELFEGSNDHHSHHHHSRAPTRHKSGRVRANTMIRSSSDGSISGGLQHTSANSETNDRIHQLKGLRMKELRGEMMKSKSLANLCHDKDNRDSIGSTHSRQNSGSGLSSPFLRAFSRKASTQTRDDDNDAPKVPSNRPQAQTTSLTGIFDSVSTSDAVADVRKGEKTMHAAAVTNGAEATQAADSNSLSKDRRLSQEYNSKFFEFVTPESSSGKHYDQDYDSDLQTGPTFTFSSFIEAIRDWLVYFAMKAVHLLGFIILVIIRGGGKTHGEADHGHDQQHLAGHSPTQEMKELQADLNAIFLWNDPHYYYLAVEFCLLLQCIYIALWATNFEILANESNHVVLWQLALIVPMLFNFLVLKQIVYISCRLLSIIKLDTPIATRISEEAIEQRTVLQKLRRIIRDKLKEMNPDKKHWKSLLYSHFSEFMDENEEITQKEWKDFLYSLTLHLTNNSTRQLFKVIDEDQDGFVHWDDLYVVIFPDLLKKKLKINRAKHRKSGGSQNTHGGDGTHTSDRKEHFSLEYHISEEDAQSYKRKTVSTRTSLLAPAMKMIRGSFAPTNNSLQMQQTTSSNADPNKSALSARISNTEKTERTDPEDPTSETNLEGDLKSILKSPSSEVLSLDMTAIHDRSTDEKSLPDVSGSKKIAVSFDIRGENSRSQASRLPDDPRVSSSNASYHRSHNDEDTDEEELQKMRERSRSIARQRSLSQSHHHSHVQSPGRSPEMLRSPSMRQVVGTLKKTFSTHRRAKTEKEEDEDEFEDQRERDKGEGLIDPVQRFNRNAHRFHSLRSGIEENDGEEDEEVEDSQLESSEASDASNISDAEYNRHARAARTRLSLDNGRAFLSVGPEDHNTIDEKGEGEDIVVSRATSGRSGRFFDV